MKMLLQSARHLLEDLASIILFGVVMSLTHNLPLAVGLGMALGVGQIGWRLAHKTPVTALQWLSVALVIVGGVASLLTKDPRFVMLKPSVINVIVGVFMLKPGWMNRYLPPEALEIVPDVAVAFGFVWAGLMFVTAGLNIVLALNLDAAKWAETMSIWGTGSMIGLFLIQFSVMRFIGRRRWARLHPDAVPA
jgi:intracellular septation protein